MKINLITLLRDVLILWALIVVLGYFFGTVGYVLLAVGVLGYMFFLYKDVQAPLRSYRVRYNTKNDGERDFWRVIDDEGVEHAADRIESMARLETETLIVDGVLKGNVVIWASSFSLTNGVASFR
jgi:hypothetical protein